MSRRHLAGSRDHIPCAKVASASSLYFVTPSGTLEKIGSGCPARDYFIPTAVMDKDELHEEPHYSIVIPVYNEEDVVGNLLSELRNFTRTWRSDYELLLVDDGSSDRTAEIIGNEFANWRQGKLIRLSRNCGQAAALFHGMHRARGQVVILLDGDGQNDPQDIPKILAPLNEVDMAVGIRVDRRDSFVRRVMSRLGQCSAKSDPGRWRGG